MDNIHLIYMITDSNELDDQFWLNIQQRKQYMNIGDLKDWVEQYDKHGHVYWYLKVTKQTSWLNPLTFY